MQLEIGWTHCQIGIPRAQANDWLSDLEVRTILHVALLQNLVFCIWSGALMAVGLHFDDHSAEDMTPTAYAGSLARAHIYTPRARRVCSARCASGRDTLVH